MQHTSPPISQKEVDSRTTLVGVDGRVVQRPDGNRLLVDAYNVLHRDYDDILNERNSLKAECEELREMLKTAQAHQANTAEAESRLQTLGDDNARAMDEISRKKSEDLLHIAVLSQIRGSLGDLVKRLFKQASDEIESHSSYSSQHRDPFAMTDIATVTLGEELQLLQQVKDRLFLILTTAASSTRQMEIRHSTLEACSSKYESENAMLIDSTTLVLSEAEQRIKLRDTREGSYLELLSLFHSEMVIAKPVRVSASTDCEGLEEMTPVSEPTPPPQPVCSPLPTKSVIVDSVQLSTYTREQDDQGRLTSCEIQQYNTAEREQQRSVLISDNAKKSRYSLSEKQLGRQEKRSISKKRKTSGQTGDAGNGAPSPRKEDNKDYGIVIEVGGKVLSTSTDCFHLGDIIMSGDGKTVITQQDLTSIISSSTSGVISVRVRRNGTMRTVEFKSRKYKKKPRASQIDTPAPPPVRSVHSRMKHLRQK